MAFVRDLDNLIPIMTSNSAPSGYVASASSEYSATYAAWKAFDGDVASNFWARTGTSGWLQIQFPAAVVVNAFSICKPDAGGATETLNTFALQGSSNGTDFTTLNSQSGITGWTNGTKKTFAFSNSTAYTHYRLNITANNGGTITNCGELELCGTGPLRLAQVF